MAAGPHTIRRRPPAAVRLYARGSRCATRRNRGRIRLRRASGPLRMRGRAVASHVWIAAEVPEPSGDGESRVALETAGASGDFGSNTGSQGIPRELLEPSASPWKLREPPGRLLCMSHRFTPFAWQRVCALPHYARRGSGAAVWPSARHNASRLPHRRPGSAKLFHVWPHVAVSRE